MKVLWQIFIAFFRVGMLGYGGGPSSIPLVHQEVVQKYKWMNDEDFSDVLALGNTLPGPIATKMAGYIGYRVKGALGAIVGVLAIVVPTVLIMISLLGFLMKYKDYPGVKGMTSGVRPVVGVMLAVLAYDFFKKAMKGRGKEGKIMAISLGVISFVAIVLLNIHPAIIIAALLLYALLKKNEAPVKAENAKKGR